MKLYTLYQLTSTYGSNLITRLSDTIPSYFTGIAECGSCTLYYKDGKLHREEEEGPAEIWVDGDKFWYKEGVRYKSEFASDSKPKSSTKSAKVPLMSSSLFNEYNAFTATGNKVADAADKFFRDLINQYPEANPRELSHIVTSAVTCVESEEVLGRAFAMRKANK